MARIDTLTAYKCKLSFLQRNNPMLEKQREAIRKGETPEYSFADFFDEYASYAEKVVKGENTDRAIMVSDGIVSNNMSDGVNRWYIVPSAGKQGRPVTVVKDSGRRYDFGSDTAALYKHHVFAYEKSGGTVMIFHRQSGSGCKSVFLETANKMLKPKGIKLEMDLILPLADDVVGAVPKKLTLLATKQLVSSDVADNIKPAKQKKVIIRELALNLATEENNVFLKMFKQLQLGSISREAAFATIREEITDGNEYNEAEISLKIGKRTRRIRLEEFERLFGVYDITEQLREYQRDSQEFVERLGKLSDEYYVKIIESEEIQ